MHLFKHLLAPWAPVIALAWIVSISTPAAAADAKHPAVAVAREYLDAVVAKDWETCANLLLPSSLERVKQEVIVTIKQSPTMTIEKSSLESLGVTSMQELDTLPAKQIYVTQRKRIQERAESASAAPTPKTTDLKVEILSVATEDQDKFAHVLHRTVRTTEVNRVRELVLVSLVKDAKSPKGWFIMPDSQSAQIENLKEEKAK